MEWWLICLGFVCVSGNVVLGESDVYKIPGCYCPPELVLDEDTGTCVPAEQCQKCFGPNESWRSGICDTYCPGLTNQTGCPITTQCFCDDAFARNEFDICILRTSCPIPECLNGREWTDHGTLCQNTCIHRTSTCRPVWVTGCFCPRGTIINDFTGDCIPIENCPDTTCKEGQTYELCGGCQRKCGEQWPAPCSPDCRPAGCYCTAENYALNANNDCVPVDQCPVASHSGPNSMSSWTKPSN